MIVSFVGLGRGITTSTAGRGGVVLTIKSRKYTIHKKYLRAISLSVALCNNYTVDVLCL